MDLFLKFESSMKAVSLHTLRGDLYAAASSTLVLPLGMQTPIASAERREEGLCMYEGCLFNCNGSSALMSILIISPINIIWNVEAHNELVGLPPKAIGIQCFDF
jgi:hypothetical protein